MHSVVVDGLIKDFGSQRQAKRALDGVSFQINRGSIFGLVGPNGAGKTTLLKTLLGVVQPTSGSVSVLGGTPLDPNVRRRMGYLPERLALPQPWTPIAFLASVARLKGVDSHARALEPLLERVGLRNERGLRIGTFSKGMRQRLGLAAALIGAPELIVLDEPTDGIDPKGRADVREILLGERERGATILLNSHLLTESERICDQVGFLVGGKLRRVGSITELCTSHSRWHARFSPGVDATQLLALGFSPIPHEHTFAWSGEAKALNQSLADARNLGAELLELSPQVDDLETLYLNLVEPNA